MFKWQSVKSSSHHDQCQTLWVLLRNQPMLAVLHLLGQIESMAFFHNCMSELVGRSCGHLMSKFVSSGRRHDRILVLMLKYHRNKFPPRQNPPLSSLCSSSSCTASVHPRLYSWWDEWPFFFLPNFGHLKVFMGVIGQHHSNKYKWPNWRPNLLSYSMWSRWWWQVI